MALLSISQIHLAFSDGMCGKAALFGLKNVDAGDTVELNPWFSVVKRAIMASDTGTHIGVAAISGTPPTIVTVPTGPVDDAVWLLVIGVSV